MASNTGIVIAAASPGKPSTGLMIILYAYQALHLHLLRYIAFLTGSIFLFSACESTTIQDYVSGTDYFPLHTEDHWRYQVSEEYYSLTAPPSKRTYQLQLKVGASFNRNGQTYFQIEEAIRENAGAEWRIRAIRTIYKNLVEVVAQEPQGPARVLLFPVSEQLTWDKNGYRAALDTALQYTDVGQPFAVGKRQFTNTISVVGPEDSTLIGRHIYRQVYGPDLGLLFRQEAALEYCQATPDCIGKGQIVSGYRRTWELIGSNRLP